MVTPDQVEAWCGYRTVKFHYGHLKLMPLGEKSKDLAAAIPDFAEYLRHQAEGTPAFTVFDDNRPVLCFGIYPIWPGLAEGWMVPSSRIGTRAVALVRGGRGIISHVGPAMGLRRLQFMVRSSHLQAVRFAQALYFKREATLTRYGPEGDDYDVFARFY